MEVVIMKGIREFGFVLYPSAVANAAKGPSGLLGWPSGDS